jgi:hypothetical protein
MAEMFMEKMHAFGNLLQDEWQVFTTPETHLPKIPLERIFSATKNKGMAVFRHFNTYNTGLFGETFSIKCDVLTCVKIKIVFLLVILRIKYNNYSSQIQIQCKYK